MIKIYYKKPKSNSTIKPHKVITSIYEEAFMIICGKSLYANAKFHSLPKKR